ncbi:MAG: hypothetical protein DIU78_005030 [Pseudomonadota bacterium]|nr:MAG: hypothetical protein DIU78_08205 [Pseudomonadota bacterium]
MSSTSPVYGRLLDAVSLILSVDLKTVLPTLITWQRLEPLPYGADLAPGLEARVADPLWLLARQWQFGEFAGEDAGSPIVARVTLERSKVTGYRPGTEATTEPVELSEVPLEALVECEGIRALHPRLAAEAGEHLVRLLRAAGVTAARETLHRAGYALTIAEVDVGTSGEATLDPRGVTWRALCNGRAIDGQAVAAALRSHRLADGTLSQLPDALAFAESERDAARSACAAWLTWYLQHVVEPEPSARSAWSPNRQEYAFSVSSSVSNRNVTLDVREYTHGQLDWHDFDVAPGASGTTRPSEILAPRPVLPTQVRYAGMPADRLFEFEDARVHLGHLEAGPSDLNRLLLAEFALVYGNDWYLIPVELDVGFLYRVQRLTIRDCFGVETIVSPTKNQDGSPWNLFTLSAESKDLAGLFFLAPTVPERLEGGPLEEVALFRDEMANLAWAVERTVQGASGEPRDRRIEPPPRSVHRRIESDRIEAELIYRLATPVPEQWLPFVPVADDDAAGGAFAVALERRVLLRKDIEGNEYAVHPRGVLLRSDRAQPVDREPPLRLNDEEVPRCGIVVTRSFQYARGVGGGRYLWVGRSKRVGRGEGESGLRYDLAISRRTTSP